MQSNVPQYILERGASAREYRRRSSCVSRTSNSSLNQDAQTKIHNESSQENTALGSSDYGRYARTSEVGSHQLENVFSDPRYTSEDHGPNYVPVPCTSTGSSLLCPDYSEFGGAVVSHELPVSSSSSSGGGMTDPGVDFKHRKALAQCPTSISDETHDIGSRRQSNYQQNRFGIARPKLVHF